MKIIIKPIGFVFLVIIPITTLLCLLGWMQFSRKTTSGTEHAGKPTAGASASVPGELADGKYAIQNKASGLYIGVKNASADPKTEGHIDQGTLSGSASNRKWQLVRISDGVYRIQNMGTQFWLDNADGGMQTGDHVRQWWLVDPTTNDAQWWRLVKRSDGYYQIENIRSKKVLGMQGGSKATGGLVYLEEAKGLDSQEFKLVTVND